MAVPGAGHGAAAALGAFPEDRSRGYPCGRTMTPEVPIVADTTALANDAVTDRPGRLPAAATHDRCTRG